MLRRTWTWSAAGTELVRIAPRQSFGQGKGSVRVSDAGRRDPHAALLVLLGVHVVVAADHATTTIVTAT